MTCLFCNEHESIHHLCIDCVVAHFIWDVISSCFNKNIDTDFESVARWWISENRNSEYILLCYHMDYLDSS
jgi:hypothetical protein